MKITDDKLRVVIAVTASSPLAALWHAAMNLLDESPGQLVALFIDDDRWQRAASLPFTREISRIGGAVADFTVQRAEQVNKGRTRMVTNRSRLDSMTRVDMMAGTAQAKPDSIGTNARPCRPIERIRRSIRNATRDM